MRCALVLASYAAFEAFPVYRFSGAPGSTVFAISWVRQQTWQESKTPISRRRWSADVGIASAISKPGALCQASCAGHQAAAACAARGGRYASAFDKTAQAMRAILLARATATS